MMASADHNAGSQLTERERSIRQYSAKGDTYLLRGLKENEIDAWAEFCRSVFAYKANPPPASYFSRHYHNDPERGRASLIRVAVFNGDIVASCRIFCRNVNNSGSVLKVGGIGEVCTDVEHRKRGLSKQLLQDCFAIMSADEMQMSLLHAAPTFFPFYQSVGYRSTESQFKAVTVLQTILKEGADSDVRVRPPRFPEDTDVLMKIHQEYSEKRFSGCIIRSQDYWNQYVCEELENALWVCQEQCHGNILGWMSIRPRGVDEKGRPKYQLREFGCSSLENTYRTMKPLLRAAMQLEERDFSLLLPSLVLEDVESSFSKASASSTGSCFDHTNVSVENDQGWMYKVLGGTESSPSPAAVGASPHLVWQTDCF